LAVVEMGLKGGEGLLRHLAVAEAQDLEAASLEVVGASEIASKTSLPEW
jgi:hypothetical protein